jgi:hypothetical protein
MSNSNHVFVGLPALIKNSAPGDPIVSVGDNHVSGIGFFDAITGGTVNRDDLGINFRNTNFLAAVGTQIYFYTGTGVTNPDWTNAANWTELTNTDLTQVIADLAAETSARISADNALTSGVNANTTAIGVNSTAIGVNTAGISTNATAISGNTTDIASNLSAIQSNDSDISSLQTSVGNNTTAIGNNTTAIALNTAKVSADGSIDTHSDVDTSTTAPNLGQVLVWDNTNWVPGTASNVGSLDDLSDVDLTSTAPELGQVLFYDGTGWIPEYPEVTVEAKNATATNFTKGQPVYVSGTAASGKPEIELADNNGANTYPAIGLLYDDIDAGAEGLVVISGSIFGLDTSGYTAGDALYVDSTPGALTTSKPTGTSQIQKVAIVKRSNISAGSLIVMGAGRVNDLPNLPTGEYWRGDASGVPQPRDFETDVSNTTAVTNNTSAIAANTTDIGTLQTDTSGNLTGSVTVHSDVTNAGSGIIITSGERTLVNNAVQPADNVSVLTNDASYITSAQAPVQDVNGLSGNVTLDADDIDDTNTTHKFTTAADITKLAGIETNATADQTAAEIKTAYESNADTNEFSDAEQTKLAGIATGAEVNVQADWTEVNTGSDAFIQNKPALGTAAAADVTDFIEDDSAIAAQPIRQYYANTAAFPSASTWHGAIAHSHADGAMYFAHGGAWVKLGNDSDIFDGDYNSLINKPVIPVVGIDAQAHDANLTTFVNAFTLPGTDGSNGQVLTTNGSGTLSFASAGGSGSTTLLGLTDTPAAFGSTGQVLAVNSAGNAVEFVNQSGGSGAQRTLTVPAGNGYSGDVVTFGSAPSGGFTVGELYYFANTGAWEEAYGTSTTTSIGMLGVCVNATTPELLVRGIIRNSNYANQFTLARRLYVSTLQGGSGRFMDSVPGSPPSGAVIRAAGFVTDAVNGVIMFDPSQDYITVT